jgi:hypothetical protein
MPFIVVKRIHICVVLYIVWFMLLHGGSALSACFEIVNGRANGDAASVLGRTIASFDKSKPSVYCLFVLVCVVYIGAVVWLTRQGLRPARQGEMFYHLGALEVPCRSEALPR